MNIEDLLLKYESLVYSDMKNYSQFTIDFIDNSIIDLPDEECELNDCVGGYRYRVQNILDVIKDGRDKELFTDLSKEINKI